VSDVVNHCPNCHKPLNLPTLALRQAQVLRIIREYRARHRTSPTLAEIGRSLGISKTVVYKHVQALIRHGLVMRSNARRARTLVPIGESDAHQIPSPMY